MEPGTDREAIRLELVRLRQGSGLSQRAVGTELVKHGGEAISGSAVGEWERGKSVPNRRNAFALERLYGLEEGTLASMMGYHREPASLTDRLERLEEKFDRIEEMLRAALNQS